MFRRIFAALLFLTSILAIFLVAFDWKVQKTVKARRGNGAISALYGDGFTLQSGTPIAPSDLKHQLVARDYQAVTTTPTASGEYRILDASAEVYSRDFMTARGNRRDGALVEIGFVDGRIQNRTSPGYPVLELEPQLISTLGKGEVRASQYSSLNSIPKHLTQAITAIEDERFRSHFGVDIFGIARALVSNIRAGKIVQGGSTITQQLAKNLLLSPKKTIGRKILEALAALSLEVHYSKDEILEMYLNEVYFGQEGSVAIHGVAEATRAFFQKSLEDLTVSEAALLSGLVKAPSYYSPKRHLKRALARRDTVIGKMAELNFISEQEANIAKKQKITIAEGRLHKKSAPFFAEAFTQAVSSTFNVDAAILSGVSIYTGLDSSMQKCADKAISKQIAVLEKNYPNLTKNDASLEAALVAIEPFSGLVKAWVGGKNYGSNQFDHVRQARRQVGSTIKPFLYLTALDSKLNNYKVATTRSILTDKPLEIELVTGDVWRPQNYDREFRGDVTLRYALERSLNVPAVYVGQRVGFDALKRTTEAFKLADNVPAVPALSLGAVDTTLLRMTNAYAALANGGIYVEPRFFRSAIDPTGETVAKSPIIEERVANEAAVFVLTNILQGVVNRGTGRIARRLGYEHPVAGKTGTSNDTRDSWYIGYSPDLAVGVWVGFDNNKSTGLTGGRGAGLIWTSFMKCIQEFREPEDFVRPPGVVLSRIDASTQDLATPNCPRENVITEVYTRGTEPYRTCREHGSGESTDYRHSERSNTAPKRRSRRERGFWDILFQRDN